MLDTRIQSRPAVGETCGSWLWCSPPSLPADTRAKRTVDRLILRTGWRRCAFFIAVAGLWTIYGHVPDRAGLAVAAVASLAPGGWCSVNFWRCRNAHCIVTGAGWLALDGLIIVETLLGHSLVGGFEGVAFLAILAAGVLFEAGWYLMHGTNALTTTNRTQVDLE